MKSDGNPGINPFEIFNLPISLNVDIKDLDAKYREISTNVDPEYAIVISNSYKSLRDVFSRGVEILKIFNIKQEDVRLPENFLEYIIENSHDESLKKIAYEIECDIYDTIVDESNVDYFARKFVMYKYIKKSFLA